MSKPLRGHYLIFVYIYLIKKTYLLRALQVTRLRGTVLISTVQNKVEYKLNSNYLIEESL